MSCLFCQINCGQAGRRHGSLASMSLCKYRSSAHLLKLTRTSVKLKGKLVCDVARLVSIMIMLDDVISDVIRPRSTIREDHPTIREDRLSVRPDSVHSDFGAI